MCQYDLTISTGFMLISVFCFCSFVLQQYSTVYTYYRNGNLGKDWVLYMPLKPSVGKGNTTVLMISIFANNRFSAKFIVNR